MSQISDKVKGAGLKSKNKIAKDTYELTFTLSDDFSFKAGQYVWVVLPKIDPPDPKGERRAFSITSSPENPKEISIIFRKGESNYKKSLLSLKKGDEVQIVGPFGSSFVVDEKSEDSFVLIAGGVGVAPFLSLLRYFDKKGTNNKFCVVTLNSSEDKVVYENELSEISSRNKNVDYACRYSGLRKESLESLPLDVGESKVFVCGPQGMVDHVDGLLNKLGVAKEDRYFEQFYPSVEKRFEVEDFRHLKPISFDDIRKKAVEFLFPYFILLGLVTSVTVGGLLFFQSGMPVPTATGVAVVFTVLAILSAFKRLRRFLISITGFICLAVLLYVFATGGSQGYGIYWASVFPIIAYLFFGYYSAAIILFYIICLFVLWYTENFGLIPFPYEWGQVLEGLSSTIFVYILVIYDLFIERRSRITIQKQSSIRDLFVNAIESSSDHIIITDRRGYVLFANKASEEITGYTFEEMQGNTPRLWGGEMSQAFYRKLWKKGYSGEIMNRRKDGQLYYTLSRISPIEDEESNTLGFVATEEDITKIKEVDELKTEFISLAAHELKTPMTVIKGFLSMILEGDYGKVSGEVTGALKDVYGSSEDLIKLVDNMLNVSRIESGRLRYELTDFEIAGVCRDVVKLLELSAEERGLELKTSELPKAKVSADKGMVVETLNNLIGNAIKYTDEGKIEIGGRVSGDFVEIAITDTGIGIAADDQKKLFEKFVQVGKKGEKIGSGLGLYITRNLVEKMGGKIWIEKSQPDEGSTFVFSIPRAGTKASKRVLKAIKREASKANKQKGLATAK